MAPTHHCCIYKYFSIYLRQFTRVISSIVIVQRIVHTDCSQYPISQFWIPTSISTSMYYFVCVYQYQHCLLFNVTKIQQMSIPYFLPMVLLIFLTQQTTVFSKGTTTSSAPACKWGCLWRALSGEATTPTRIYWQGDMPQYSRLPLRPGRTWETRYYSGDSMAFDRKASLGNAVQCNQ